MSEGTIESATTEVEATAVPDDLSEAADTVMATLMDIWNSFLAHLPFLFFGLLILIATSVGASLAARVTHKIFGLRRFQKSLSELIERLVYIAVWAVGLLLAAMVVFPGLTPTKALGGLGILSLAVGFAFKDIFENFFAGILILWRFPFDAGDFIECEAISGKIEEITIRNTLIRQTTGELVVVPNSYLFTNPVDVLTNWKKRRVTIMVGVAYGEDVSESCQTIREAIEGCDTVSGDKPVEIFPQAFGSSSIDIEVAWWTDPRPLDIRRSRGEVVTAIKSALDEAGIEIPFPYRTLTFKDSLVLEDPEN